MKCAACVVTTLPKGCHNTEIMCQVCRQSRADTLAELREANDAIAVKVRSSLVVAGRSNGRTANAFHWLGFLSGVAQCQNEICDREAGR
jgi:hypothetical protein